MLVTDLMTVAETAKRFGVHELTVRNWSKRGLLEKPIKVGPRRVFYRRNYIEGVIAGTIETKLIGSVNWRPSSVAAA